MTRGLVAVVTICCMPLLALGCGSSSSNSSNGSGGSGSGAGQTTTTGTTPSSSKQGGLKPSTTPKFAAPSASSPVQSGVVQIAYRNIAIAPDTVKVKVGSTIKWTNYDSIEHNVTSKGGPAHFASENIGEGETFEVKVTKPGLIHYECTIHPTTMNGSIEVVQ